jgi:protein-disulfide isomerase
VSDSSLIQLPIEGNAESRVQVVAFEDLQCKDCAAWRRMLDDVLLPRFEKTVGFVSRDFPLEKHHWAESAAMVCRRLTAIGPEHGVNFRRYCYQHLAEISVENFPERIVAYAESADLDSEDIAISVRNIDFRRAVELDRSKGTALGVEHTPTAFVGELRFVELFGVEEVISAIEKALKG